MQLPEKAALLSALPNIDTHFQKLQKFQKGFSFPRQFQRALTTCLGLCLILALLTGSFTTSIFGPKKMRFPRKIWQTWKVDVLNFDKRDSDVARSWIAKNPSHRYEVLTDMNDMSYIETHFGPDGFNRMDIVYTYRQLGGQNLAIIKADLLRYLIMYAEGGLYTDIDVEALRSIDHFVPERFDEHDVGLVVGVEIDEPEFSKHPILGQKSMSFCQWTFMCKPELPVMMSLIEQIMDWLRELAAQQRVPISNLQLDFDQVIDGTGPSAFTRAILREMSKREGRDVTWKEFHDLAESKLVGGVLVLTVEAFAAGQGHSDSGNHEGKHSLVRHNYHASGWPEAHPRYRHPIFGEVEECNWDPECVRKWDEDTARFSSLSAEDQSVELRLHEARVEEERLRDEERRRLEEEERLRQEEEDRQKEAEEKDREGSSREASRDADRRERARRLRR